MSDEIDITNSAGCDNAAVIRTWKAVDSLIENAPLNCTRIELVITADGHNVSYSAPSQENLLRFSYRSVHGEWIK